MKIPRSRNTRIGMICLVALICMGKNCDEPNRSDTTLHSNGEVDRKIYQRQQSFAAADPEVVKPWSSVNPNATLEEYRAGQWKPGKTIPPITDGGNPDAGDIFVAATGHFKSPTEIPDHLRLLPTSKGPNTEGTLSRDYQRSDDVLVVKHQWKETLTQSFSPAASQVARGQLVDLALQLAKETFAVRLAKDYDATALFKWLETEGRAWFLESAEVELFMDAAHASYRTSGEKALVDIRHGVQPGRDAGVGDAGTHNERVEEFVYNKIASLVRKKSTGKPVDSQTVREWLAPEKWFTNKKDDPPPPLKADLDKAVASRPGGKAQLDSRIDELWKVAFGGLSYKSGDFRYVMTLPGLLVETNGRLLGPNRVIWDFNVGDAFPFGYTMHATSLEAIKAKQAVLLKGKSLDDIARMTDFVSAMGGSDELREVMNKCVEAKSFKPLLDHRRSLVKQVETQAQTDGGPKSAKTDLERVDELLDVLKVKVPAPSKR